MHWTRGLVTLTLLFGCQRENPSFDGPGSGGGGSGTHGSGDSGAGDGSGAEPTDDGTGGGGSGGSGASSSTGDGGGLTGSTGGASTAGTSSVPATFVYDAIVAVCSDPTNLDPDVCEQQNGMDQIAIDLVDSQLGVPFYGFIRFDLDGAFAGQTVTDVTLQLTTSDHMWADSPASGEIWEVTPFTLADLYGSIPGQVGSMPLAADRGAVVPNQVVEWSLGPAVVSPGGSVFLGVYPTADDGTTYWNADRPEGPKLIVTTG